jgi:hypothetical protein
MFAKDFLHQGRKGMDLPRFAIFAPFCSNLVPALPGWVFKETGRLRVIWDKTLGNN